jgi:predicted porin
LSARVNSPGTQRAPTVFNNHITRTKLNYQFTRELSLRLIMDYNAVLPNALLAAQQRTKRVTGDVLLTYLLSPGTAFYMGYTDQYANLALQPGSPGLIPTNSPTTSTGRQFFVKVSYLFRR